MNALAAKARKLLRVLLVPLWRRALLRRGVAAGVEHIQALRQLGVVRTMVDIGANRGQFALAARHCFPEARIVSFEPLPEPATAYRAVFADDPRARIIEAAVGPEAGESLIHVSARDDSSSLLPITARQSELFPGTSEVSTATIRVGRLGDYVSAELIEAPALLKLDVQGFELRALAGCEEFLGLFDWVYVECSFVELYAGQALADDVIAWLCERGFVLTGVYNMTYDRHGRAIQADFMFRRSESPRTSERHTNEKERAGLVLEPADSRGRR